MATAKTIHVITWNINGFKKKKYQTFQEVSNAADVVFLQETHIGVENEHSLDIEDKWKIYCTRYASSRKGSAILVRKTLDFELISQGKDVNGAYLVLKCKLEGQPYTLVSVYNHHRDVDTLDQLSEYLRQMASGMLVIGGDFNTVLNPFVDKETQFSPSKVTNNASHNKLRRHVEKFMKSLQLVDVWRRINPTARKYTFNTHNIRSRLDYFFIPEECMWRVKQCDIKDVQKTDHQPLSLEVNSVPVIPCKKDQEIQYIGQLLHHKAEFGIVEADLSSLKDDTHAIDEVEIVTAIQPLQVSDTPRPDGISVTFYKDCTKELIPYLKVLYRRMLSGLFDFQKTHFCDSVQEPHCGQQHFFNADYLIIATILARRLDAICLKHLVSQSMGSKLNSLPTFWITFKAPCPRVKWSYIKNALEEQKQVNSEWCQDFVILENLLRNSDDSECSPETYKHLRQGCPLTPVLMTLVLKSISSKLIGHLEQHRLLVFRQSVIVCVRQEDQDEVEATLVNLSDHLGMSDIVVLSRNNGFLNVRECEENWEFEFDEGAQWTVGEEAGEESYDEQEESDDLYQESGYEEDDESNMVHEFYEDGSELMPTIQHRQTMYAVVTLASGEVVVVAKNWLTEDRQQSHWPPFKSPENFTEAVKSRSPPVTQGKQWEKIKVTFNGEYGTCAEAKNIQRLLSGTKVQKQSPVFGPAPLKRRKLNEKSSNPAAMLPAPSRSIPTAGPTHSTAPRPQSGSSSNEHDKLVKMLKEINSKVQENSLMLKELLRRSKQARPPSSTSMPFHAKLPLNSLEELEIFENKLRDESTRENFMDHLSRLGGSGQKQIVRGIMDSVMTDDLAEAFNWQGRQNKRAICGLELTKVIKVAALYAGVNVTEVEKEIKNWLRYSADRNARKKLKDLKDTEAGNPTVTSGTASDISCDSRAGYDPLLPAFLF
ncbi:hypothetical protein NFI96_024224, partial [Prochilodus magdalenae]